jgi:hypothetical protein
MSIPVSINQVGVTVKNDPSQEKCVYSLSKITFSSAPIREQSTFEINSQRKEYSNLLNAFNIFKDQRNASEKYFYHFSSSKRPLGSLGTFVRLKKETLK